MRPFFFLCLVSGVVFFACIQSVAIEWESYTYSGDVYDLRLKGGKLLCATVGGLLEFDPQSKTFVKYTNIDGLLECPTTAVDVDDWGNCWMAHSTKGVTVRSPAGRVETFTKFDGIPGESLFCVGIVGSVVVIGTDAGACSLDTRGNPFGGGLYFTPYLQDTVVRAIFVGDTVIWYGTALGLCGARRASPTRIDYRYTTAQGLPGNNVRSVVESGSLWVGTDGGVGLFQDTIWVSRNSGLPSNDVRDIIMHRDTLWAATRAGAAFLDGTNWYVRNSGLPSGNVTSLAGDTSSLLWCGTISGGIAGYDGVWRGYSSPGLLSNDVEGVAVEEDGAVWVVYDRTSGVSRGEQGEWQHFRRDSFYALDHYCKTVSVDKAGNVWFATWFGGLVERTAKGEWHVYTDTNGFLPTPVVSALDIDPDTNKWIACYFLNGLYGIAVLSPDNARTEVYSQSPLMRITDIAVDSAGKKWFASYQSGVHVLSDGGTPFDQADDSWRSYQEPDLPSDEVRAVSVDKDGDVYVSTTGGVARIRDGIIVDLYYGSPGGLPSGFVYKMVPDWEGGMWFEHEYGITRRNPDGSWDNYSWADGLVSDKITYLHSHLAFDEERGDLFIGTSGGLSRFHTGLLPHASFDSVEVYPNPFVPSKGHTRVTFRNIPEGSTVRIYTMSGELVREIDRVVNTFAYWDGKNNSGENVKSGIYLFGIGGKNSGVIGVAR